MKENFYDIDRLKQICVRTIITRIERDGEQTGKFLSEGCYAMEIINYSIASGVDFEINGQKFHLERGVDLDPTAGRRYWFDSIKLPGHVSLVRSDEIKYTWESAESVNWNMAIIRHVVMPFNEKIDYSVYTLKA